MFITRHTAEWYFIRTIFFLNHKEKLKVSHEKIAKEISHTNRQPVYPWTPVTEGKQMLPSVHQWISCQNSNDICGMLVIQNARTPNNNSKEFEPSFDTFFQFFYRCGVDSKL